MPRTVEVEGEGVYEFPDDATEEEIQEALGGASSPQPGPPPRPAYEEGASALAPSPERGAVAGLKELLARARTPRPAPAPPPPRDPGVLSQTANALARGLVGAASSIASLPELVNRGARPLADLAAGVPSTKEALGLDTRAPWQRAFAAGPYASATAAAPPEDVTIAPKPLFRGRLSVPETKAPRPAVVQGANALSDLLQETEKEISRSTPSGRWSQEMAKEPLLTRLFHPAYYGELLGQGLGSMVPTMAASAAKVPMLAAPVLFGAEAGEGTREARAYEEETGEELRDEDVFLDQVTRGLVNSRLERIVPEGILSSPAGRDLKRRAYEALAHGGTEGLTEFLQEIVGNVLSSDPRKKRFEGSVEAGLGGALTGAFVSALTPGRLRRPRPAAADAHGVEGPVGIGGRTEAPPPRRAQAEEAPPKAPPPAAETHEVPIAPANAPENGIERAVDKKTENAVRRRLKAPEGAIPPLLVEKAAEAALAKEKAPEIPPTAPASSPEVAPTLESEPAAEATPAETAPAESAASEPEAAKPAEREAIEPSPLAHLSTHLRLLKLGLRKAVLVPKEMVPRLDPKIWRAGSVDTKAGTVFFKPRELSPDRVAEAAEDGRLSELVSPPARNRWAREEKARDPRLDRPTGLREAVQPEPDATLEAQLRMLREGKKDAVLFPTEGGKPRFLPQTFSAREVKTPLGTIYFNPRKTSAARIFEAIEKGTLGDVLGYGVARKPEKGTEAGVVTLRDAEGTEKQAAVVDEEGIAPAAAAAAKVSEPGDRLSLEPAREVVDKRREAIEKERAEKAEQAEKATAREVATEAAPASPPGPSAPAPLPARRPFLSPEELLLEELKKGGAEEHLVKALAPHVLAKDDVTGFSEKRHHRPTVERVIAHVRETGEKAVYLEIDVHNLGGGNAALGHSKMNALFRRMATAVKEEVSAVSPDAQFFRHGGDEISVVAPGASKEDVEAAMARAHEKAALAVKEYGVDDIAHAKGQRDEAGRERRRGLGLHWAVGEIDPSESVDRLLSRVDREVERRKWTRRKESRTGEAPREVVDAGVREGVHKRVHEAAREAVREDAGDVAPEAAERKPLGAPASRPAFRLGGEARVVTERGTKAEARWAFVEAGDLLTSHDDAFEESPSYPKDLQPRDRTRRASELQVSSIASALDPDRLSEGSAASGGAPVVGEDGVVESGNGRTMAIRRAYREGKEPARGYRSFLATNASRFGLDGKDALGMKAPVLVRVRTSEVRDRAAFAREANESSVLSMSAAEEARGDASKLTPALMELFSPGEDGSLDASSNRDFVRAFLSKVVDPARRARYVDAEGRLSREGLSAVRNAVFYRAYGDSAALERLAESLDDAARNVTAALVSAAPAVALLREGQKAGRLFTVDVVSPIVEAARVYASLRSSGKTASAFLSERSLFGKEISDEGGRVLALLERERRSARRLTSWIRNVAETLTKAGDPRQGELLGEARAPSVTEVYDAASRDWERALDGADQPALLEEGEPPGGRRGAPEAPPGGAAEGSGGEGQGERDRSDRGRDSAPDRDDGAPRAAAPLDRPAPSTIEPRAKAPASARDSASASSSPLVAVAREIAGRLSSMERIDAKALGEIADRLLGGRKAEGKYASKDLYDATNLALNLHVLKEAESYRADVGIDEAKEAAKRLEELSSRLPTQTRRTDEQVSMQQYSTPPPLAYAASFIAGISPSDTVLEPSAGEGNLAVYAKATGATVYANELSERRRALLSALGLSGVTKENAEQLHNVLPDTIRPTVVVMNPPFSQTAGRLGSVTVLSTAARHIDQALKRLEPGGRLVTIVGRGMTMDAKAFLPFWQRVKRQYRLRANVGLSGSLYTKQGTSFGTRLLVIDKPKEGETAPPSTFVQGEASSVERLLDLTQDLAGERHERPSKEARDGREAAAGSEEPRGESPRREDPRREDERREGERREDERPEDGGREGARPEEARDQKEARGKAPREDRGPQRGRPLQPGRDEAPSENPLAPDDRPAPRPDPDALGQGRAGGEPEGGLRDGPRGHVPRPRLRGGPGRGDEVVPPPRGGEPGADLHGRGDGRDGADGGRDRALDPPLRPDVPRGPARPAGPAVEKGAAEKTKAAELAPPEAAEADPDPSSSSYERYEPRRGTPEGGIRHPSPLVESAAMAAVKAPPLTYTPDLPQELLKEGRLSSAQLESVAAAGQAHEKLLASGPRRGYFLGDGTGVGKGRQIAAILLDNFRRGRKKAVWVSQDWKLLADAGRDVAGIGWTKGVLFSQEKVKAGEAIGAKEGVLFTTYSTLASGFEDVEERPGREKERAAKAGASSPGSGRKPRGKKSRLDQLASWLGEDFDGAIVFDESHAMANGLDEKGERGKKKASKRASAGMKLQALLPKARVVYVSATGATDVANLAYAERLGLWGRGTSFPTKERFVAQVSSGGLAAMELVARDLKAMGLFSARTLSFSGVTHERLVHELSEEQRKTYDDLAGAWRLVLTHIDEALELTASDKAGKVSGAAKSAVYSKCWSSNQRFWNQVLTALQMPTVLSAIEGDVSAGNAAVLQLVNTNEAASERALGKLALDDEDEETALDNLDITPREELLTLVDRVFPTKQKEEYEDENGNVRLRDVLDSEGRPIENKEAVRMKEDLLDRLGSIKVPSGPLELLLDHFGKDKVAEVTGRKRRVLRVDGKAEIETRGAHASAAEIADFMDGRKDILVFSMAGATGASYHADRAAKNQKRRIHYLLQAGWRADQAIQGFGRTHRSNQVVPPVYRLVSTDIPGHSRFVSTIARRLDQLGALTKGQRDTGGQGIFSELDNLEGQEAKDALAALIRRMAKERDPIDVSSFEAETGLALVDQRTGSLRAFNIPMPQFLNRLLSMRVKTQRKVFDAFLDLYRDRLEAAKEAGTLDRGVETLSADKVEKKHEAVVYRDPETGAETKHVELLLSTKKRSVPFEEMRRTKGAFFVLGKRSGRVYAALRSANRTDEKGRVRERYRLVSPTERSGRYVDRDDVLSGLDAWRKLDDVKEAERLWKEETARLPEYDLTRVDLVTGAILPIWDRLKGRPRVYKVVTDEGEKLLGREIPEDSLRETLRNLGAETTALKLAPEKAVERVLDDGVTLHLANGWKVKSRKVAYEDRIEIEGPQYDDFKELREDGAFTERINYEPRVFVPVGEKAVEVLGKLLDRHPLVDVTGGRAKGQLQGSHFSRVDLVEGGEGEERGPRDARREGAGRDAAGSDDGDVHAPASAAGAKRGLAAAFGPAEKGAKEIRADVHALLSGATVDDAAKLSTDELREERSRMRFRDLRLEKLLEEARNHFESLRSRTGAEAKEGGESGGGRADAAFHRATVAFMDDVENGRPQKTPELDRYAALVRAVLDEGRDMVRNLGRGHLERYYRDYFPHLWKDHDAARAFGEKYLDERSPSGPKGFLRRREIPTIADGLEAGLSLKYDNPIDAVLAHAHQLGKFVAKERWMLAMRAQGVLRPISADATEADIPKGWERLHTDYGTIYGDPEIAISEYQDEGLRDQLEALMKRLGIRHVRRPGLGPVASETPKSASEISTKFASEMGVLTHEIGHQLDGRYRLFDVLTTGDDKNVILRELRALADLRGEGLSERARERRHRYFRKKTEQIANFFDAFVNHRKDVEEVAPYALGKFRRFVLDHPELDPVLRLHPTLRVAERRDKVRISGRVVTGYYIAPTSVVRTFHRDLSPGLRDKAAFQTLRAVSNALNQAQLGLSAFHLAFTSMDAMTSRGALGLREIAEGAARLKRGESESANRFFAKGVRDLLGGLSPWTPVRTLLHGRRLMKEAFGEGRALSGDDVFGAPKALGEGGVSGLSASLAPSNLAPSDLARARLSKEIEAVLLAGGAFKQYGFYKSGMTEAMKSAFRRGHYGKAALRAPMAFLETMAAPIMEYVVPRQKLGVFLELAAFETERLGEDASREELRHALARAWDSVDNRMGQLVYDNLFWNRTLKDLGMLAVRSLGWNLGSLRELGGAVFDAATTKSRSDTARKLAADKAAWKARTVADLEEEAGERPLDLSDPVFTHRMAYALFLPFVVGLYGAIYQLLKAGKPPDEPKDYFFPRTGGKNPDGTDERVSLPTYWKDVYAYSHAPVKTLSHKVHPALATFLELTRNEDFYGVEIQNPDDDATERAIQVAAYLAKQLTPFSVRQLLEANRPGSKLQKWEGFAGITKAPASVSRTRAENEMMEYLRDRMPRAARTPQAAERTRTLQDLEASLRLARAIGDREGEERARAELARMRAEGKLSPRTLSSLHKDAERSVMEKRFQRLPLVEAMRVYGFGTETERRQWAPILRRKARTGLQALPASERAQTRRTLADLVAGERGAETSTPR